MRDKIGKLPTINDPISALKEIIYITEDKRNHVLLSDCIDWLELKIKVISKLAKEGLNSVNNL